MVAAPALALIVAACSSAAGAPGFTYAPPVSPTGSPITGVDPSPSTPTTSGAPAPTGSAAPVVTTVAISAQNIQFDTDHLEAPAGQAWVLEFSNNDAGVPHNVEILDAGGASVFKGEIVTGPTKVSYEMPALPAGTYMFLCDVHPTMTGTLTVA
ncbi:MAG: cupredoxin domain-containing protein [Betaproteobacteria bacterium]